jgi:hypothetical protein
MLEWRLVVAKGRCIGARIKLGEEEEEEDILPHPTSPFLQPKQITKHAS